MARKAGHPLLIVRLHLLLVLPPKKTLELRVRFEVPYVRGSHHKGIKRAREDDKQPTVIEGESKN